MKSFALRGNVVTKGEILENALIVVRDGFIEDVLPHGESSGVPFPILSFGGHFLFPGLVDLHIHGLSGFDVTEHGAKAVQKLSERLPAFGVTGFLPTTLTTSWERLLAVLDEATSSKISLQGARVLGLHLEGPYLSPERKGAHHPLFLRIPKKDEIAILLERGQGIIKRITIAPELEGAQEAIAYLAAEGILVSLGHSVASYHTAEEAFRRGAKLVTHLFNGMDPLHHRNPNLLAFALENEEIYTEIIADTIHVSPEILKLTLRCKTSKRLFPVSDAIKVAGFPDGVYPYDPEAVKLTEGKAELAQSKTLAGSVCLLNQALRNLQRHTGLSLPELALMGSFLPAKLLGAENILGSLERGKKADIVVFDEHFTAQATFIEGEKVYERP